MKNPGAYEILGIAENANINEIRKAYRKLAMQWHPDRNKAIDAVQKFQIIKAAYEELLESVENLENSENTNFHENSQKIFDKKNDLHLDLEISLAEGYNGCQKIFEFSRVQICETCSGDGDYETTQHNLCRHCHGIGKIGKPLQKCNFCNGKGFTTRHICPTCQGQGNISQIVTLNVQIPAGILNGGELRLQNQGEQPSKIESENGIVAGDLYLNIHILNDEKFELKQENLYSKNPLLINVLAFFAEQNIEIILLNEKIVKHKLSIKDYENQQIILQNCGYPILANKNNNNKNFGDLIIPLSIKIPQNLNDKQKKVLQKILNEIEKEN